ncbi:DUF1311 domain-containing protein [Erwinia mallotivora]|uniref:DUF1311 domain-containing protein n=1 Tax=Erwinia mallotivora TaxID=69222 RepID=UPI0021C02670|nr:DUF1311 domain-containing protein [Erwinia mallotivora]
MKKQVITMLVVLSALPLTSSAELSWGTERENCFKQEKTIPLAYDCLAKKKDESNRTLDALISETDKRIKANNIGPFNGKEDAKETSGDVYSKRFLEAQGKWKQYRQELCLAVATEIDEDSYDYQSYRDQCEINLNKRHMEEINMMGLPPVS